MLQQTDLFFVNRGQQTYTLLAEELGTFLLTMPKPPGFNEDDKYINDGITQVEDFAGQNIVLNTNNNYKTGTLAFEEGFVMRGTDFNPKVALDKDWLINEIYCPDSGFDVCDCISLDMDWITENLICDGTPHGLVDLNGCIGINICSNHDNALTLDNGCLGLELCGGTPGSGGNGGIIAPNGCLEIDRNWIAAELPCVDKGIIKDPNSMCLELDFDKILSSINLGKIRSKTINISNNGNLTTGDVWIEYDGIAGDGNTGTPAPIEITPGSGIKTLGRVASDPLDGSTNAPDNTPFDDRHHIRVDSTVLRSKVGEGGVPSELTTTPHKHFGNRQEKLQIIETDLESEGWFIGNHIRSFYKGTDDNPAMAMGYGNSSKVNGTTGEVDLDHLVIGSWNYGGRGGTFGDQSARFIEFRNSETKLHQVRSNNSAGGDAQQTSKAPNMHIAQNGKVTYVPDGSDNSAVTKKEFENLRSQVTELMANKITSSVVNAADDAAAAYAGVEVGGLYRNGSQLMVRVS